MGPRLARIVLVTLAVLAVLAAGAVAAAGASVTEYTVPTSGSEPWGIANGPDGALRFTENGADKFGRITTTGSKREFALPVGSGALDLTTGPDRALSTPPGRTSPRAPSSASSPARGDTCPPAAR